MPHASGVDIKRRTPRNPIGHYLALVNPNRWTAVVLRYQCLAIRAAGSLTRADQYRCELGGWRFWYSRRVQ